MNMNEYLASYQTGKNKGKAMIKTTSALILLTLLQSCANAYTVTSTDLLSAEKISKKSEAIGEKVYQGNVFPDYSQKQEYFYERWISSDGDELLTEHITYNNDNKKLVIQSARENKSSELIHYDEVHIQKGYIGSILIEGNMVKIIQRYDNETQIKVESLCHPVVVGPTLFGYIKRNWNDLIAGNDKKISFGLIERLETFGFTIKVKSQDESKTKFVLTPSSFIMKAFVGDLEVDFDTKSKKVLRYKGPVPQYHNVKGDFEKINATSIYKYF
jgi:hypothetical protein